MKILQGNFSSSSAFLIISAKLVRAVRRVNNAETKLMKKEELIHSEKVC